MTKIIGGENCGNSPRSMLLRDLNIAFAKGDIDFILEHFADEIVWNYVGDKQLKGKEAVAIALRTETQVPKRELHLLEIITHGKAGGVNGVITLENGNRYGFSHVYHFSSTAKTAPLKTITSYIIEMKASE